MLPNTRQLTAELGRPKLVVFQGICGTGDGMMRIRYEAIHASVARFLRKPNSS